MDSQIGHVHGRNYEQPIHSPVVPGEGHDAHGHEKKSVVKKVKDKAKKIKQSLTKHHGHEHEHEPYTDEDEEEDEEMESDPEVHGAPIYDSREVGRVGVTHEISGKMGGTYGSTGGTGEPGKFTLGDAISGDPRLERDPQAPTGLLEKSSPGNYQAKVADPTRAGGEVAGVEPLADELGAMTLSAGHPPTGSHGQFSPEPPSQNAPDNEKNTGSAPDGSRQLDQQPHPASYADKLSAATSAIAGTAISAKDAIASKLGYGHKDDHHEGGGGKAPESSKPTSTAGVYGQKIKESLAPVYEKVTEVRSGVASKISGKAGSGEGCGGVVNEVRVEATEGGVKRASGSAGEPASKFLAARLRPGDEDRALSEVISDALHKRNDTPDAEGRAESRSGVGETGSGKGVVERIKGAMTSLFTKGAGGAQAAYVSGEPREGATEHREERRLQESTNY